jgi:hypothetical protein
MRKFILFGLAIGLASCSGSDDSVTKNRKCLFDAELVSVNHSDAKAKHFDLDVKVTRADNLNNTRGCERFKGEVINISSDVSPMNIVGRKERKEMKFMSLLPNEMAKGEKLIIWETIEDTDKSYAASWEIAPVGE